MPSYQIRFRWLGLACCLAVGCTRGDHYRPRPIGGVRFFAMTKLNRGAADTLWVSVSAHNRGRRPREIESGGCVDALVVRAVSSDPRPVTWDSHAWRQAEVAQRNARRDTIVGGRPVLSEVCLPTLSVRLLAPRDSGHIAALAVPVRAVLGDSLPPGRYRIQTRLGGNGWEAGYLVAGEVELRAPPT